MKKLKQIILLFLVITISTTSQAQLGGLLKKAKEKVTEKEKKIVSTSTDKKEVTTNTSSSREPMDRTKEYANRVFTFPDATYQNEYQPITYNVSQIKEKFGALESLSHVRKEGEKGTFHFAKDYPELKDLINDEHIVNATIQFSGTPFKNGKGDGKTSFSSNGDHIYAQLEAKAGTIKDVFDIKKDENIRFSFMYYIYSDDADKLKGDFGFSAGNFVVTPQMAKEKYLALDIMPKVEDATLYANNEYGFNRTGSHFASLHKQENFSKSGNYKIRVVLLTPYMDEWGKPISGTSMDCNGFFDYSFSAKDVTARFEEANSLHTYIKEKINNAPVALPASWKEKSATPAMGYTQDKLVQMFRNHFKDKLSDFSLVKFHTKNSNGGWNIQTNDFGIPRYRYSNQWYTVFMKSKNGKTCFYQGFGLRQDYTGGGTYGEVYVDTEPFKYLNCEEMK